MFSKMEEHQQRINDYRKADSKNLLKEMKKSEF
jgi:hypothetical protein